MFHRQSDMCHGPVETTIHRGLYIPVAAKKTAVVWYDTMAIFSLTLKIGVNIVIYSVDKHEKLSPSLNQFSHNPDETLKK